MPKIVTQVPEPMLQYMDGQLWEFTKEEFHHTSPTARPMVDESYNVIGMRLFQWYRNEHYYIRYVKPNDTRTVEELAGWTKASITLSADPTSTP